MINQKQGVGPQASETPTSQSLLQASGFFQEWGSGAPGLAVKCCEVDG